MAVSFAQKLEAEFKNALNKKINSSRFLEGVKAMGVKSIEIIRKRAAKGIDVDGFAFDKYSKNYPKQKQRAIAKGKNSGEYAATKVLDWMRSSGQLFRDFTYKVGKTRQPRDGEFRMDFTIDIKQGSRKKAEGLMKKRKFWGIATKGNQRFLEQSQLIDAFKKGAGINGTGRIK